MKKYLDLTGLGQLCSNLKNIINKKAEYEYGSITAEDQITEELNIGTSKYMKMVLVSVNGETPLSLTIKSGRSTQATRYQVGNIQRADIENGIEIEVINTYIILRDSTGKVLNTYYRGSLEDEINLVFVGESSSDSVTFQYRLEV